MLGIPLVPFLFPAATCNPSWSRCSGSLAPASTPTPKHHWTDQYTCEYLGHNNCWQPSIIQEGPPYAGFESRPPRPKKCVVQASRDPAIDDAPAIRVAFDTCHEDSHIVFENTTYYVHTVLNTTGLRNVDVEVLGTLVWDNSNIQYWLRNSLDM